MFRLELSGEGGSGLSIKEIYSYCQTVCHQALVESDNFVNQDIDTKNLDPICRNSGKDACSSDSRSLQLQLQLKFLNAISLPVFTGTRIEGEGGSSVEVALVDIHTGEVVSNGTWSSAKVEVVVLEGDFDGDEGDNWSLEEFANNIVREREGKKPLLTGDVILTLNNGTGSVGDISFTDNSSWTRSRKFRLGARLVDDSGSLRIQEARSDPFVVRDHRGECEFSSWSCFFFLN